MATKKKKKKKRNPKRKTLKAKLPEKKGINPIAFTTTGEAFQPVRIHYEVSDPETLQKRFSEMECMDYDPNEKRWVWGYTGEAEKLEFEQRPITENPIVLGEFIASDGGEYVLNLRSPERAVKAIQFFDEYVPRSAAQATHVSASYKLFSLAEATALPSLHQFFEKGELNVKDPEKITRKLIELKASTDDEAEQKRVVDQYIEELANEKIPEIEKFSIHYYEDGIEALQFSLSIHKRVALEHWKGNTGYTPMNAVQDMTRL